MKQASPRPPRLTRIWLKWFSPTLAKRSVIGDMDEEFVERISAEGLIRARLWYSRQSMILIPAYLFYGLLWSLIMLKNNMKVVFRSYRRNKLFSILNILGLATALACVMLIVFHVRHELSYEKCFPDSDRIYRLTINSKYGDTYRHWAVGSIPLGPMIKEAIPEIEKMGRISRMGEPVIISSREGDTVKRFEEPGGTFGDPSILDLFPFKVIHGDPGQMMASPMSVILTRSMAERYFGDQNPMGKTMLIEDSGALLQVTGVIEDLPSNTHLNFNFLMPFSLFEMAIKQRFEGGLESRTWKVVYTYAMLHSGISRSHVEQKFPEFFKGYLNEDTRVETLHIQPIREIHLHSKLEQEMSPNSDFIYVLIFSSIAVLILIIACVNYVNMSTAQAFKRMKEVGLRKVLGAHRIQLVRQFLADALIMAGFALLAAWVLVYWTFPLYARLSGYPFAFKELFLPNMLSFILLTLVIGLCAGMYPALFISKFEPLNTIKSMKDPRSKPNLIRKVLVIVQFIMSVFLMIGSITIFRQMNFFRNADLGFDRERLLDIQLYGELQEQTIANLGAVKNELIQHAAFKNVALTSNMPGERLSVEHITPKSLENTEIPTVRVMRVDEGYLETMGLRLIEGRNFAPRNDDRTQFILSEAAVKSLGIENQVGQTARGYFGEGDIVGVIADFHFASLHSVIEPLVLEYKPAWCGHLLVRFQGESVADAVDKIKSVLDKVVPDYLFRYSLLDDRLNLLYADEDRIADLFNVFMVVAILISCLGLFGLSMYSAEVKVKEIGIRKVLGSGVLGIVLGLNKQFAVWVIIANVVAWPVGFYAMKKWLESFAYRVEFSPWTLIVAGTVSLIVAQLAVSLHSFRAATANPVNSLRHE